MSHTSTYKMKITDLDSLKVILDKQGVEYEEECTTALYGSNRVKAALAFKLPGWRYAIAVTKDGEVKYDHFGSGRDTMKLLGETVRDYNELVIENKAWGFCTNFYKEKVEDGLKLTIEY